MPIYKCSSCGATIGSMSSASGQCEYCGTPFDVESIRNCKRLISSERVTSGVPFSATPEKLYGYVRDFLTSASNAPSDVLEKAKITSCHSICLPAYYYHYTGESSFTCQVENIVESTVGDGDGGTRTVTNTNWTPFGGNVYVTVEGIVSGNSNYDNIIDEMYKEYDISTLVDAESLKIPSNIETIKFERSEIELLSRYVTPNIEKSYQNTANQQLSGINGHRNLSIPLGRITKEKEERLIIGIYNIDVEYNSNNYSMYVSGDGEKVRYNNYAPAEKDDVNFNSLTEAQNAAKSALTANENTTASAITIAVISFIVAISFIINMITSKGSADTDLYISMLVISLIFTVGGILFGVDGINKKPSLVTALNAATDNLNNFNNTQKEKLEKFKNFDRNGLLIQGSQYLGMR